MKEPRDFRKEMDQLLEDSGGFYLFEDIMEGLERGQFQSFAVGDTWLITQVHEFPRRTVIEITYCVGNFEDVVELLPRIEEYAQSVGATRIIASGRPGWGKIKMNGWKQLSANFIGEINGR